MEVGNYKGIRISGWLGITEELNLEGGGNCRAFGFERGSLGKGNNFQLLFFVKKDLVLLCIRNQPSTIFSHCVFHLQWKPKGL